MKKALPLLSMVLLTGGPANISGGSDYTKYVQTPEECISYQITHNIHDNAVKDQQYALVRRAIDSIKTTKP